MSLALIDIKDNTIGGNAGIQSTMNMQIGAVQNLYTQYQLNSPTNFTEQEIIQISNASRELLRQHYESHTKLIPIIGAQYNAAAYSSIDTTFINLAIVNHTEQTKKEKHFSRLASNFHDARISSFEDLHAVKSNIQLDDIFNRTIQDKVVPRRIIVLGRAGIGKTTLCQYASYQWLHQKLWHNQFDWVFWIPLRNLAEHKYKTLLHNVSVDRVVAEVINQECLSGSGDVLWLEQLVASAKKTHKVLLLLDGYDEIAAQIANNTSSLLSCVIEKLLKYPTLLVTSRPYSLPKISMDKTLENMGFTDENIKLYIKNFFTETKRSELLLERLETNPNMWGIAHIPINLNILCNIWYEEHLDSQLDFNNGSLTSIYGEIKYFLSKKYLVKRSQNPVSEDDITGRMSRDNVEDLCQPLLQLLENMAFLSLQHSSSIIIENKFIKQASETLSSRRMIWEDLKESGLVKGVDSEKSDVDKDYYFIHLTFQDFFAAQYIIKQSVTKEKEAFHKRIVSLLAEHKYSSSYKMFWQFIAGLLAQQNRADLLGEYFNTLNDHKISNPSIEQEAYEFVLLSSCIEEANEQGKYKQQLIEKLYLFLFGMSSLAQLPKFFAGQMQSSPKVLEALFSKIENERLKIKNQIQRNKNNGQADKEQSNKLFNFQIELIKLFEYKTLVNINLVKYCIIKWNFNFKSNIENDDNTDEWLELVRIIIKWRELENDIRLADFVNIKLFEIIDTKDWYTPINAAGILYNIYENSQFRSIYDYVDQKVSDAKAHIQRAQYPNNIDYFYVTPAAVLSTILMDATNSDNVISFLFDVCDVIENPPDEQFNYAAIAELRQLLKSHRAIIIQEIINRINLKNDTAARICLKLNIVNEQLAMAIMENYKITEMPSETFSALISNSTNKQFLLKVFNERLNIANKDFKRAALVFDLAKLDNELQVDILLNLLNSNNFKDLTGPFCEKLYQNFIFQQKTLIATKLTSMPMMDTLKEVSLEDKIWYLLCLDRYEVDEQIAQIAIDIINDKRFQYTLSYHDFEDYTPEWQEGFLLAITKVCNKNKKLSLTLCPIFLSLFKESFSNDLDPLYQAKLTIAAGGVIELKKFFLDILEGNSDFAIINRETIFLSQYTKNNNNDPDNIYYTKLEFLKILISLSNNNFIAEDFLDQLLKSICSRYETKSEGTYQYKLYRLAHSLVNTKQLNSRLESHFTDEKSLIFKENHNLQNYIKKTENHIKSLSLLNKTNRTCDTLFQP